VIFSYPLAFDAPVKGVPVDCHTVGKTRMVGLPNGEKTSLSICITVYTQYRGVTDRQTDGQTDILPWHSLRYAYMHTRRAVKKNENMFIRFDIIHERDGRKRRHRTTTSTSGQSNLTKSALRGPISRLGVTPGGRKLYH